MELRGCECGSVTKMELIIEGQNATERGTERWQGAVEK